MWQSAFFLEQMTEGVSPDRKVIDYQQDIKLIRSFFGDIAGNASQLAILLQAIYVQFALFPLTKEVIIE